MNDILNRNKTSDKFYTIGYQSRSFSDFIGQLKNFKINTLIDVREVPNSRRKEFSKTRLSKYLKDRNIEYIHLKDLGSPKEIRNKLKMDNDYNFFFKKYSSYLHSKHKTVRDLYQIILSNICCIMCYEKLPEYCHRSVICKEVKKIDGNGIVIEHIN